MSDSAFPTLFAADREESDSMGMASDAPSKKQPKQQNNNIGKTMLAASLMLALAMPLPSDAAMTGGRMGGSFSSTPSYSRSAPSTRSYSSPVRSYSYSYSYSYARPRVSFGYGYNPFVTPYYGGAGIISYSRGPSFFDLVLLGGFMFALTSFFREFSTSINASSDFSSTLESTSALGPGISVAQVSVAIEVPNRDDPNSILSTLDRISQTAKTNNRVGIQNLTSQVALELLRRKSSIVSASTSYRHFNDFSKAGRDYEAKAIKERSKFEQETVSKYGGVDYAANKSRKLPGSGDGNATIAVVTLLVAIQGDSTKLPKINSASDAEEALRRIASDSKVSDCLQSVEILWTPEDRSETLTMRDVLADYPELRAI